MILGSRPEPARPAPVAAESRQDAPLRLEWYLLDAHQKFVRGEISRAQFQGLVKAHEELVRNMALLRGQPAPPPARTGGRGVPAAAAAPRR